MDNDLIILQDTLAKQHAHDNNQPHENLPQKQSISERSGTVTEMTEIVKKNSMDPTFVEHSWWSRHRIATTMGSYTIVICLVMTIGILLVCLTSPKARGRDCVVMLYPTVQYSNRDSSHPQSIAIGDFNNDSHMDIVAANSGFDNVAVFLGYGNDTFKSQMTYFTGNDSAPQMVAVSDFNNDSLLDIVVANFGTNNIGIFLGNGNATFMSQTTIDTTPSRPLYIAVDDFNNDTHLDIAFVGYGTNTIGILLGFGNGKFRARMTFSTGYDSLPYSVAVGDFNDDNKLDLAVANSGTDNVGILLGYGNGTFAIQTTCTTGINSHPYSIAISDLNNDNQLDIAVGNLGADNICILFGYGNGSFTLPIFYSTCTGYNSDPISIIIADFNDDKNADIAIANNGTDSIDIIFGYGNGTFANQITYSTGFHASPHSIGVADFNDDNQLDIAIANQLNNNIKIFNGYTNATFATPITYETNNNSFPLGPSSTSTGVGSNPFGIDLGDFNKDGRLDIVISNPGTNNIGILLGYGNGSFESMRNYSTGDNSYPLSVIVGDFNNDSRLDISVTNFGANNVGILLGYGDGTFTPQITYSTDNSSGPGSIAIGDFNDDTLLDIAVANYFTNNVGVLLGYSGGTFAPQIIYPTGDGSTPYTVAVGDLNNDGRLDIIVANYGRNSVGVLLGYGDGTFAPQIIYSTGENSNPYFVTVDDLNNDDRLDIVVANSGTDNVGILLGYGDGTFSSQVTYSTGNGSYPTSVTVGDFNNDDRLDIAVTNMVADNVGIFFGYGDGKFLPQIIYFMGDGSEPDSIIIGDLNNDSRLDIATANQGINNVGVLLEQDNGTFLCLTCTYGIISYTMSIASGDFNNDNQLDIAVVNSGTNNIDVLLGYGSGNFASPRTYSTGDASNPVSVALRDLNNDRRLDIVIANAGTNNVGVLLGYGNGTFAPPVTYSTGDSSTPYSVTMGDLNNDGRFDIAVANHVTNNVGIFLGHGDGTFASQIKYSTGDDSRPISVTIGDFNNDGQLDIAVANYKASNVGVLLGYGDGTFRAQKTFSTGPYSLPLSLAVGDFNNDNNLDIAVGCSVSDEGYVLILLGNGNGNFSINGPYLTGSGSMLNSIVVGYFNKDTRLDIAVANYGTNNLGTFLGYGDGTFSTQTTYPTNNGSHPVSIAVGDFNGDNQTDIVTANYGTFTVDVFLGVMSTSFVDTTTFFTGSAAFPGTIALGDFTNDGQLDIVVGNDGTHNIGLLTSDANGSFIMQTAYSADSTFYPGSIVVTDFNNDTYLDIAVINAAMDNVNLLFGNGNGTLGNSTTYSTGTNSNPQSIAIGDFNNDHQTDIAVAQSGTGSVGLLLKSDNAALKSLRSFSTGYGSNPHGLAVGDFDNDSRLDIVVANYGNENIGFFFGLGNGSFSSQITISLGESIFPTWVGVGDFNDDKRLDVVVAVGTSATSTTVLLGNGDGSFRIQKTYGVDWTYAGAVGDLNSDGQLDVVFCEPWFNSVKVLLGYGNGTFGNLGFYSISDGSNPYSVTIGDFNNDNRLDIAVTNTNTFSVGILRGHGDGKFSSQIIHDTGFGSYPYSIVAGDFNNDNQLDIAVANWGTDSVGVLFGYGNGSFSSPTTYSIGNGSKPRWIDVGDFNNDGQLDIIVTHYDNGYLGILLGHINGTFFNEITYTTGENSGPFSIGVGDFNKDGRLDVTVSLSATDNIGVFLGYASKTFLSTTAYSFGDSSQPVSIAVGDFNNDTFLDVVVADYGTNNVILLYGSGYGTFSSQKNYSTGDDSYPNCVVVGDFNEDHQLDIAVVNSGTNTIGILLRSGNGSFSTPTIYSTGDFSSPQSLAVGHFDNDTHLDIAVANSGISSVCLFYGYGNGSFGSPSCFTSGFGSNPSAVVFGDVNGDNMTDIVICDSGYSTIEILSKFC